MYMKWFSAILIIIIALVGVGWYFSPKGGVSNQPVESAQPSSTPTSETVTTTSPTTAPAKDMSDQVVVDTPKPNNVVSSPFTIVGKARGTWFFEASMPVSVFDSDGKLLWSGPAQAQGEWMTTDFVPFSVTANVGAYTGTSTVMIAKDNPSGLPEHDASYSFQVIVK